MDRCKKALQMLWTGRMTVTVKKAVKDEITKLTNLVDTIVYENEPCRLSYNTISTVEQGDDVAKIRQATRAFCSPDLEIPSGSKITITQNGQTSSYQISGKTAIYSNHQEIPLEVYGEYA